MSAEKVHDSLLPLDIYGLQTAILDGSYQDELNRVCSVQLHVINTVFLCICL